MDPKDLVVRLLRERNLIAFVGAGTSRTVTDGTGRVLYEGLPDARGLVERMAREVNEITADTQFEDAAYLYRRAVGEREYRRFLKDALDPSDVEPLPAHRFLAFLPFASYVSMNFDRLLEKALSNLNQNFETVISEQSLSAPNVLSRRIVLKPHGCISNLDSIISSTDQLLPYSQRAPFMDALLRVLLTNTPALFVGFGLRDPDFKVLVQGMRDVISNMPRSYAITKSPSAFEKEFWREHNIDVIEADLTEFLQALATDYSGEEFPLHFRKTEFLADPVFSELSTRRVRKLPTETEVIEAFLDSLLANVSRGDVDVLTAVAEARASADRVLAERSNYHAFKIVIDNVLQQVERAAASRAQVCEDLALFRRDRSAIAHRIQQNGRGVIKEGDRILLFSQSVRVRELLQSVAVPVQETCELLIAECRPKSPRMFFDAAFFADSILSRGSKFKLSFITDAAMTSVVADRKIDKAILGAHNIIVDSTGKFTAFVNTCGSLQIALACEKFGVPLYVVAERDKFVIEDAIVMSPSTVEEERLELPPNIGLAPESMRRLSRLPMLNIGYDMVPVGPNVTLIHD